MLLPGACRKTVFSPGAWCHADTIMTHSGAQARALVWTEAGTAMRDWTLAMDSAVDSNARDLYKWDFHLAVHQENRRMMELRILSGIYGGWGEENCSSRLEVGDLEGTTN